MNILTQKFNSILKEEPKRKWERLKRFRKQLELMIENEALNAEYQTLVRYRVIEEMGYVVASGEAA